MARDRRPARLQPSATPLISVGGDDVSLRIATVVATNCLCLLMAINGYAAKHLWHCTTLGPLLPTVRVEPVPFAAAVAFNHQLDAKCIEGPAAVVAEVAKVPSIHGATISFAPLSFRTF